MAREQKYQLLGGSGDGSSEKLDSRNVTYTISKTTRLIFLATSGFMAVVIVGLLIEVSLLYRAQLQMPQLPEPIYANCGGTPEEARRRGCSFDWMMSCWYTRECHHPDLLAEAAADREWEWYLDPEAKTKVPTSVIALGEHNVAFTTEWFHREHCAYMWKKQLRYVNDWKYMDNQTHVYEHTAHCANFVLQPTILKAKNDTFLIPQYPSCVSLRKKWDQPIVEQTHK